LKPLTSLFRHWLSQGRHALGELFFPWFCPLCEAPATDSPFCDSCQENLLQKASAPACGRCALPLGPWSQNQGGCFECRGRPLGFDAALALGPYEGKIRDLCLRLKHEANAWLAPWLAKLLIEARPESREFPPDSWVVPIPLHWRRRWERGYNQAEALASGFARHLSLRLVQPLRRARATPHLADSGRAERARVMRNAFSLRARYHNLTGRTVLLVDDILTTGATCGAAARALKRAGARRVVTLVIGRTEGT